MTVYFSKLGEYGRLGNCLFQAACTIALALRNNDSFGFPHNWKYKDFFNIPSNSFVKNMAIKSVYNEPYFHYAPIPYKNGINLLGYFQSSKYFDDYASTIKEYLTPKYNHEKIDMTSIHVRRDDYLKYPQHHPTLNMEYYEKAIELVGGGSFLIFSDDINWCKNHFIGNNFEFSENNSNINDLVLQSKCKNNIIANSSFSWWGAYLNSNTNKQVIAPKKWFGPALSMHNTDDLYCNNWIVI